MSTSSPSSAIWMVQRFDRDRRCCTKLGFSVDRSNLSKSSISLRRLGKLKQIDSRFAVDPSSAGAIVVVLTKDLWAGCVCWNVRQRNDRVTSGFFPPRKISPYKIGVKILFQSREIRQHATSVFRMMDYSSSFQQRPLQEWSTHL